MKALCKTQPSAGAELVDRDRPQAGPNEIVVEVRAAAICGTDKHLWQYDAWAAGRLKLPRVFGHECSGDVIEVGSEVTGVSVGDFVSLETHVPCGHCRLCRTDRQHICQNLSILGVDIDGCFAEAVKVPALCAWKNPSDMPTEVAAIQEPFGNAVYSCETAEVRSKSVVIFGDGPIASFATGIAKAWGAREVVVVGLNTARLGIAEKMGADRTLDARDGEVVERLRDHTDGEGFEVVLEMAGVEIAIQQGLSALAKGGTFVAFGIPSGNVSIDYTDALVFKEAKVLGVNGRRMFSTWYQTQTLLMTGQVDVGPVLTHSFGLGEFERAFGLLEDPASEAGKVILKP